MTRFLARELSTAHWFDISAARRDFGYDPAVSIDEGLRRLREAMRGDGPLRPAD
jgi:nucleoside-diphosphate-sugar epimerase